MKQPEENEQPEETDDSVEVTDPDALGGHDEDAQDNFELWIEWQS